VSGLIIDLFHHLAELLKVKPITLLWFDFRNHGLNLGKFDQSSLSLERFLQVLGRDEAGVVHVKVMESEFEVGFRDNFILVHCCRQEFRIVNFTVLVKVDLIEDNVQICLVHTSALEGFLYFINKQGAGVLRVECAESLS
jgi:hypothetical protein